MSLDVVEYLSRTTTRAKSDVANKLVSMFLHQVSRKACLELGGNVTDRSYGEHISKIFGNACSYCSRVLEPDRTAIEHIEAMNRVQAGLHIPGNVVLACKQCNNQKRRDDSATAQILASTGWESFLSHDSSRCPLSCQTCSYWKRVWPEKTACSKKLRSAQKKIAIFRQGYSTFLEWSNAAQLVIRPRLEKLYRDCQLFAQNEITNAIAEVMNQSSVARTAS